MTVLEWKDVARIDLMSIIDYISHDNPEAAQHLKDVIELKILKLLNHPRIYKRGRLVGTREMVVKPNYVVVYKEDSQKISILRILHAAREWPPQ